MTRLESLVLQFRSPRSRSDPTSRPLPPRTRVVLPTLTSLTFQGVYEYLEDLLALVNPPLLNYLRITFFMDLNFDLPQLHRLIDHTEEFKTFNHSDVLICDYFIRLTLNSKDNHRAWLQLQINCSELEWQLSSLAQVCSSSFPLISTSEELQIREDYPSLHWKDDMENAQWLELLDPFTALKNLYLTDQILLHVCTALLELSRERVTEVLPALQNIVLPNASLREGSRTAAALFVATRRRSGHPVRVHGRVHGSTGRVPLSRIRALQEKLVPESDDEVERARELRGQLLNAILADAPTPQSTPTPILAAPPAPGHPVRVHGGTGRVPLSRIRALQEKLVPESDDEVERANSSRRLLLNAILADAPTPQSTTAQISAAPPPPGHPVRVHSRPPMEWGKDITEDLVSGD